MTGASTLNWTARLRNAILVFGSNTAGRHGAGSALFAKDWYGAETGIGIGPTGRAYAVPTKDSNIQTLSIEEIKPHVDAFLKYANDNFHHEFWLTRIGCGLAGFTDEQMAPLFAEAPENVLFPGKWLQHLGRLERPRVIIAGSRDFNDASFVFPRLDHTLNRFRSAFEVVCGEAPGVDTLGKAWGKQNGAAVASFPADWNHYGRKLAGPFRNITMAWYSTHLIAFPSQEQRSGTKDMIACAKREGLESREFPVTIPDQVLEQRRKRRQARRP